jgi:hypothetical protein
MVKQCTTNYNEKFSNKFFFYMEKKSKIKLSLTIKKDGQEDGVVFNKK